MWDSGPGRAISSPAWWKAAAAARVIGIDVLLTEPDRLAGSDHKTDAILAASLRQVPVVLAAAAEPAGGFPPHPMPAATIIFEAGNDSRADLPHYRSVSWPQAALAGAASGTGLVTVPPEADGIMRRMPTVASVGSVLIPSFAVEVVRVATHADRISFRVGPTGGRTLEIGDRAIPTDAAGGVWPRYAVNATVPSVPADRVLTGEIDSAVFRDRVVLIGTSAPGLGRCVRDPAATPAKRSCDPGAAGRELAGGRLAAASASLPPPWNGCLPWCSRLAAIFLFGRIGDKAYALLCSSTVILVGAGSFAAFAAAGILLDATLPVTALLGTNLIVLADRTRQEVRARRKREVELANALREAELRTEAENARESLAIALDAAQMGMWDVDLIGGTSRRSARHDEIFGYAGPPPEWGRETLLSRVIAEDRDTVARNLDAAMETGALRFQCRIRRPDGALGSIAVDGRVYHDADGTPPAWRAS